MGVNLEGWYFNQIKGTCEDFNEADIISCVEYDKTGDFLATGDHGGRIVIFKRESEDKLQKCVSHNVYCTFVSHEPEFDYLKSLEIEEKINKIRWLPRTNHARFLLSTNDKTIKLWRITERCRRVANISSNISSDYFLNNTATTTPTTTIADDDDDAAVLNDNVSNNSSVSSSFNKIYHRTDLRVPYYEDIDPVMDAHPKRIFANAHAYLINSLSVNSDQETFLSADDLRINLWNLEITNQSFNIVDLKPVNMEDLSEVITAAQFHPSSCSLFIYSSSKGTIRLCDMRQRALCDEHALSFEEVDDPMSRCFFSEIINNISDLNFSHSGRYILSRDYLTLKVWDLNMPRRPVETYLVHDYFRTKLCALYENDCIFDKFECQWSPNDNMIVTGSYNNYFRVFERGTSKDLLMEASREAMENSVCGKLKPCQVISDGTIGGAISATSFSEGKINVECMDLTRKLLHLSWHPREHTLALAGTSSLYLLDHYPDNQRFNDSKTETLRTDYVMNGNITTTTLSS
ncbi:hypothetical protein MN116_005441 [Schistosoma mekongi]|uniref:Serine/threonine-protein phosphatase 2A 55 kDa regulatory subunit B n=1 Tax=Schistosoma mekongi TaxID=38744 RepID=A0AAE1ZEM6_SCHME|nr:hypothetical protein MN116_005441 [Schistosoma mekongi]